MGRKPNPSGDVFADLELPDAEDLLAKAELTRLIHDHIAARGLTQGAAAKLLGLKQPDVSLLMRGRHTRFSTERLLRLLLRLGRDVEIVIRKPRPANREHGRMSVVSG